MKRVQTTAPWQAMVLDAAGVCCAVGYNLAAASCALRAGMDHFQDSEFVDGNGEPLKVARLPLGDIWGPQRLAQIAALAVLDCLKNHSGIDLGQTALLLLAAEQGRPHTETERYHETYLALEQACDAHFHAASAIFPAGRAGIGEALLRANQLLCEREVAQVLLVGVDSYLNAASVRWYLQQDRLLASDNSDGFIPGEAAAALLLRLASADSVGLHISGVGCATEPACPNGDVPNRAFGLTQAMRQACQRARLEPDALDFRMSDQNGEQFFAREGANACTRMMSECNKFLPLLTIADGVGEVGAATGALMIAYLSEAMARWDGPGFTALAHLANDDGRRCALVLEQFA